MDLTGQTLGGQQIIEEVGRGGMAVVYRAYQPSLHRHVAIKVLAPQLALDRQFVDRFLREARAAGGLHDPNIVVVYDVGEDAGLYYIVMEYLQGQTLKQLVASAGSLPPARAARILEQIASALDHAHDEGFVHRDVKAANIFVGKDDRVTLTDFGIAKAASGAEQLTRTGTLVGTPEYMSPEQADDRKVDHRTDLYAMGVVLYEMLTGRVPFKGATAHSTLHALIYRAPPPPRQINPHLSPAIESVVLKGVAKDPDQRFQRGAEMASAMRAALAGRSVPAVAATPPAATPKRLPTPVRKRSPLVWVLGGLAAVLVVVLGVLLLAAVGGGDGTPAPGAAQAIAAATSTLRSTEIVPTATRTEAPPPPPSVAPTRTPVDTPTLTSTAVPTSTPTRAHQATEEPTEPPPTPRPTSTSPPASSPTVTPSPTRREEERASSSPEPVPPPPPSDATSQEGALTGRIAFSVVEAGTGDYLLYSVKPDGTGERFLGRYLRQPSYRQDGQIIVANGQGGGVNDLWTVHTDGRGRIEPMGHLDDEHPIWLQSAGYHVGFDSLRWGDGEWRIYLGDAPISYGSGGVRGRYPVWGPGESVVYRGCDYGFGNGSRCGLYRVSMWGGTPVRILEDANAIPTGAGDAGVLYMLDSGGSWDVYLVGLSGGNRQRLTADPGQDGLATFSPDGGRIAFLSDRSGAWAIWLMQRNGTGPVKVYDLPGGGGYGPEWFEERLTWGPPPLAPAPAPTPTGGHLLAPPTFIWPRADDVIRAKKPYNIEWSWEGRALRENEGFEVRLRTERESAPAALAAPGPETSLSATFAYAPIYEGPGLYYVDVLLVQKEPWKQVSHAAGPIRIRLEGD